MNSRVCHCVMYILNLKDTYYAHFQVYNCILGYN